MGIFDFFSKKKKENNEEVVNDNIENVQITDEEVSEIETETQEEILQEDVSNDEAVEELKEIEEAEEIEEAKEVVVIEEEVQEITAEVEEETEEIQVIEPEEVIPEELIEEEPILEESLEEDVTEEEIIEEETLEVLEEFVEKKGLFAKLKDGLEKTRKSIVGSVDLILNSFTKIDEDLFEELEETLIMADVGVETTMLIIENIRKRIKKEGTTDPSLIKGMIIDEISTILSADEDDEYEIEKPSVLLVIGVNGVGKTTTIGKLSNNLKSQGNNVLLAAADTFRAAAIDQLEVWGERSGIEVIKHAENSDPASVIFDAVKEAKKRKTDILICDTAGRLHNKKNLMEELRKIAKVIDKEYGEVKKETYLVLDATTGQNALQQAKLFKEVADITGIILTKLDGTAKGGIVVAIKNELQIPIRYIGVGEGIQDLQKFDSKNFAKALFE